MVPSLEALPLSSHGLVLSGSLLRVSLIRTPVIEFRAHLDNRDGLTRRSVAERHLQKPFSDRLTFIGSGSWDNQNLSVHSNHLGTVSHDPEWGQRVMSGVGEGNKVLLFGSFEFPRLEDSQPLTQADIMGDTSCH